MDTPRVSGLDFLGSIEIRHEYLMKSKSDDELRKNLAETRAINNADERLSINDDAE